MLELEDVKGPVAKIKVIGVGGAGGNTVSHMAKADIYGVELIAVNTDKQHLENCLAPLKVQIGNELTKGLGSGGMPAIGMEAAREDKDSLASCLEGADMVFVTAGMGGGTGTGASPFIAGLSKELGILTVAVVTSPFSFEGRQKILAASSGIAELKKNSDAIIVISNDKLLNIIPKGASYEGGFSAIDDILRQAVQGISDVVLVAGKVNVDFADLKNVLTGAGKTIIGMGKGKGENAADTAARQAIRNPLFDSSIDGAKSIIVNITGSPNLPFRAIPDVTSAIYEFTDAVENLKFGVVLNKEMEDEVTVTIVATGFEEKKEKIDLPNCSVWVPKGHPINLKKESRRILIKSWDTNSDSNIKIGEHNSPEETMQEKIKQEEIEQHLHLDLPEYEDVIDIPTFLRQKKMKAQNK